MTGMEGDGDGDGDGEWEKRRGGGEKKGGFLLMGSESTNI